MLLANVNVAKLQSIHKTPLKAPQIVDIILLFH